MSNVVFAKLFGVGNCGRSDNLDSLEHSGICSGTIKIHVIISAPVPPPTPIRSITIRKHSQPHADIAFNTHNPAPTFAAFSSSPHIEMSSLGQPIQPGAAGHSIEKATATTTSEITQKQFVATGSAVGPACEVGAERAVGTAKVDTAFLGAKPDLSGVEASLNKVAASEAEVAAKQAAAQAALQQAGLLSAAAQEEALRTQQAKLEVRRR